MKHPLSMGLILLLQTIFSCMACSLILSSYLLSYILFLIFVGGMLILFMYMSSIASNEKFVFSMKLMFINLLVLSVLIMFMGKIELSMMKSDDQMSEFNEFSSLMLNKLYMFPYGNITLMMVIYLLFSMIVVVNIISLKSSPLRSV
uniref:NADH-ubiquinone oxidoreductase chain 6 n=1 Tax=Diceroprocta semicincta TaxID=946270 RepID=A0A088DMZ4_9HEMI|nr:NADH dehydrogenase subunit 6 [Diceroprocta semicincta]